MTATSERSGTGAEAAIDGAGRTPLLRDDRSADGPAGVRAILALVAVAAAGLLALLLLSLPSRPPLLAELVAAHGPESGSENPVTAVLLNFRAYDTLLELTVLAAAVVAVWSLDPDNGPQWMDRRSREPDPVLHELTRLVVPLAAVVAVYLAWAGSYGSGGGFQAGALLSGAAVLLAAGGYVPPFSATFRIVRILVGLGLAGFVLVGLGSLASTGHLLGYPPAWAHGVIVGLESVVAALVTVILIEFFVDAPSVPAQDPSLKRVRPTGDPLGRILTGP